MNKRNATTKTSRPSDRVPSSRTRDDGVQETNKYLIITFFSFFLSQVVITVSLKYAHDGVAFLIFVPDTQIYMSPAAMYRLGINRSRLQFRLYRFIAVITVMRVRRFRFQRYIA